MAGETEQDLPGDLEEQEAADGAVLRGYGRSGRAASRLHPACGAQRLLRTRELEDALGEDGVGIGRRAVGVAAEPARQPERAEQDGDARQRGRAQRPGEGDQGDRDGDGQQHRADHGRDEIDDQPDEVRPGGGDRLTGRGRVPGVEPAEPDAGDPVGDGALSGVEQPEAQPEAEPRGAGVDGPARHGDERERADPRPCRPRVRAEQGRDQRYEQDGPGGSQHDADHGEHEVGENGATAARGEEGEHGADHRATAPAPSEVVPASQSCRYRSPRAKS